MMKGIYVAGPFSNSNVIEVFYNMRRGMALSSELLQRGYVPFCPFIDFHFILSSQDEGYKFKVEHFYNFSLHWLRKCDVLLCIFPEWKTSKGTIAEIREAHHLGMPIFYDMQSFYEQIKPGEAEALHDELKPALP